MIPFYTGRWQSKSCLERLPKKAAAVCSSEAQAAASLNHPNIVSIFDAGEMNGLPYIVMELVSGSSLHVQKPARIDQIIDIALQICAALEYAHANGIIHRDLKPENIILSPDGRVKILDFGLARSIASRLSSQNIIAGSVFYLAPEQALGQEIDGRADLYSLGVILYELVTGQLPFSGDDPLSVISQHLYAPVVAPSTYQADAAPLEPLILRLLAKDPRGRYDSAHQVMEALQALAGSEAFTARQVELYRWRHPPQPARPRSDGRTEERDQPTAGVVGAGAARARTPGSDLRRARDWENPPGERVGRLRPAERSDDSPGRLL